MEQERRPEVAEERPGQAERLAREATGPTARQGGLFSNAALKEAIELLPLLPPMRSLAEVRVFLKSNLHFSAAETRERYAGYIARRLFPAGEPDAALRRFAHAYAGRRELKDVCFYRFCIAEPLMYDVMDDVLIPSIGAGQVARGTLRSYLAQRFPVSRNVGNTAQGIVGALTAADIAKSAPGWLRFGYREVPAAAFAFVLHSEFPSGMYDMARLEQNRAMRALLWHPDRLVPALYDLRNARLISKISQIDGMRQFTTSLTLEEVVDALAATGVQA